MMSFILDTWLSSKPLICSCRNKIIRGYLAVLHISVSDEYQIWPRSRWSKPIPGVDPQPWYRQISGQVHHGSHFSFFFNPVFMRKTVGAPRLRLTQARTVVNWSNLQWQASAEASGTKLMFPVLNRNKLVPKIWILPEPVCDTTELDIGENAESRYTDVKLQLPAYTSMQRVCTRCRFWLRHFKQFGAVVNYSVEFYQSQGEGGIEG